jgi:hypothetical protein
VRISNVTLLAAGALLLTVTAIANAQTGAPGKMTGDELREIVADTTLHLKTEGTVVRIVYRPDSTMGGRLASLAAALVTNTPATDRGTWWIVQDRLCQRWNRWLNGESYCYTFTHEGRTVHWVRSDGRTGTARIGG